MGKKMIKWIGLVVLVVVILVCIFAVRFCYHNLHWWEKDMRKIEKLGVEEKQVTLPNGYI